MREQRTVKCFHCNRMFFDVRGMQQHAGRVHKIRPTRLVVHEETLADIAVDAYIKQASGEYLDPLERSIIQMDDRT